MTRLPSALRRKRTWMGAGVIVLLCVASVVAITTVLGVRDDLRRADKQATTLVAALRAADQPRAARAARSLDADLRDAVRGTGSVTWRLAERLPWLGEDARTVRLVATVGQDLSRRAVAPVIADGNPSLLERLTPHDGRVDLRTVHELQPLLAQVHGALRDANTRLGAAHTAGMTSIVRPQFDRLVAKVDDADRGVDAASRAATVLPSMLGEDGPRYYLLAFNNNAEIRATGGIAGSLALLEADHGRIRMVQEASSASFGQMKPVAPLTAAERAIYDVQPAEYVQDTNFTPEYPRTAALLRAMWAQRFGRQVDGVLSVDTVTLSYLLRATGPLELPDGTRLTADNAVDELLSRTYARLPDNARQDAFFASVAQAVFKRVTGGGVQPSALADAAARGVRESRIYMHSFHPAEQSTLDDSAIAGNLGLEPTGSPQIGIYLNDATGAKLSYYLRARTHVAAERCDAGRQAFSGWVDLTSTAPKDPASLPAYVAGGNFGAPKGDQLVLVRVYGPVGGEVRNFRFDGKPVEVRTVDDRGRPVATGVIQLKPGQTTRMGWDTMSGPEQTRDATVSVTPTIQSRAGTITVPGVC